MSLVIRKCTISEMESSPNISDLLNEYAEESSIGGLPHPSAKVEMYKHMENAKAIYVIGAFLGGILIGYVTILSPVLPHYSIVVAVTESFFVAKDYRKTGAGLKLLHEAEIYAESIGSPGLLVSAPIDGNLEEVLPHVGYSETSKVFFKRFQK